MTVGYVAAFKGIDASVEAADLSAYTHVNIAFANPAPDGSFIVGDALACMPHPGAAPITRAALRGQVARLRQGGRRVLVSLGGGTIPACAGDWRALLAPGRRGATVANLLALVEAVGFDGVDVDIEGALLTEIDRAGDYTPFIAALSAALRPHGKLLTCATASYEGGMIPRASIRYFDLVNVMSYDAIGPTWGKPGDEHANYAMAARDLDLWHARGVARERLVLGVPFYGYGYGGLAPNWSYRDLAVAYPDRAARGDTIGAPCAGCAYITYNGPDTIARKAGLARAKAGGVMVWEIAQDAPDHALARALVKGLRD